MKKQIFLDTSKNKSTRAILLSYRNKRVYPPSTIDQLLIILTIVLSVEDVICPVMISDKIFKHPIFGLKVAVVMFQLFLNLIKCSTVGEGNAKASKVNENEIISRKHESGVISHKVVESFLPTPTAEQSKTKEKGLNKGKEATKSVVLSDTLHAQEERLVIVALMLIRTMRLILIRRNMKTMRLGMLQTWVLWLRSLVVAEHNWSFFFNSLLLNM